MQVKEADFRTKINSSCDRREVETTQAGSVNVDVAIDQGGSIETVNRITTHSEPTYEKHGVLHYAVANTPDAFFRTSTIALTNVTTQYGLQIANKGYHKAAFDNKAFARGINVMDGKITFKAVAEANRLEYFNIHSG